MRLRISHRTFLGVLVFLVACEGGTSTGNPNDDNTDLSGGGTGTGNSGQGTPVGSGCQQGASRELALDEETPLGFAARDVLDIVEGTHQQTISWNEIEVASYEPEHGDQSLTIQIARQSAPRWVEYARTESPMGGGLLGMVEDRCLPTLEVDLQVSVQSDEGALNEKFTTTLYTRSTDAVTLSFTETLEEIGGNLVFTPAQEGFMLDMLYFDLEFTKDVARGEIRASFSRPENGAIFGMAGLKPLATWGPAACAEGEALVRSDTQVANFSADDAIALIQSVSESTVTFADEPPSRVVFSTFAPENEFACAYQSGTRGPVPTEKEGPKGTLSFAGSWNAVSDDGRINASWPVLVRAVADDAGNLAAVSIRLDSARIEGQTFAERYGIAVDPPSLDVINVALALTVTPTTSLEGTLNISGYDRPVCQQVAPGAGGHCPAATIVQITSASFEAP